MTDEDYMRVALAEARKGWGKTQSNPMVGAVIVEDGRVVSRGFHARFGGPHAEIEALSNLGRKPSVNSTMYVTLEPCSTTGKTGPCTEAIIGSGIAQVVVGAIDPDKRHEGKGVDLLNEAGVKTKVGVLSDACEDLNLIFNHWSKTERPFFAAKTATTLDGKVATRSGSSQWITGEKARADVMLWRRYFPSIAVGSGTALADDPSLTSRLEDSVDCGVRFIFDRRLRTMDKLDSLKVYNDDFKSRTVLVCGDEVGDLDSLEARGVSVWRLPLENDRFWKAFRENCISETVTGVYFEGGSGLLSELLARKQLDYLFAYRAPKFLADAEAPAFVDGQSVEQMAHAYSLKNVEHSTFGDDQLTRGFINYSLK